MPKRSRAEAAAPQVVINVNTLNNYFAAAPAAPAAPPEAGPAKLFATNTDRLKRTSVVKNGKPCSTYVWYSASDGTLKGGCYHACNNQFVDLANFAPVGSSAHTKRNRIKWDAAYTAYKKAHTEGNRDECIAQRAILETLRSNKCFACRDGPGHMSPAERACKEWYDATRKAMAAQHDGCQHPDCPERGPDVWQIIGADHGTNPKKRDAKGRPVQLSDYAHWPALGGVPAMAEEAKQIEKWICHFCHRLELTSRSGRRCPDPETMPKGKSAGTPEERAQYKARLHALRVYPKHQYVDAAKRRIGKCVACKRPVLPGQEAAFDFNHIDESTKEMGGLFRKKGGVSGLVNNAVDAATLDKVKDKLDAEIAKCNLPCCNCHVRHTWGYGPSPTVFE